MIADMTYNELAQYFHLPISKAAEKLGICGTILKKQCRLNGIERWPYRKIKSIDDMIIELESIDPKYLNNINLTKEDLLKKRAFLLEYPNTPYQKLVPKYTINTFKAKIQEIKDENTNKTNVTNNTLNKQKSKISHTIYIKPDKPQKKIQKPPKKRFNNKTYHNNDFVDLRTSQENILEAARILCSFA